VSENSDKPSGGFSEKFSDAFQKPSGEQRKESSEPQPAPDKGSEAAKPSALKRQIVKAFFLAVTAASLAMSPAHAQSTKAQLNSQITTNLPDNTVGQITPQGLRTVTSGIVNSIMPTAPVVAGNLSSFNGTTGLLQDSGLAASVLATAGFNAVNCLGIDDTATIQAKINATSATSHVNLKFAT
jgi:hypothetical protein